MPHSPSPAPFATVPVALADRAYDIHIGPGLRRDIGTYARVAFGDRLKTFVIVSNPTVWNLYGGDVLKSLRAAKIGAEVFLMGDGERFKNIWTAEKLWDFCIERRIERGAAFLAVGGGVVGDLAGFAAATYLRGVPFAQIPTTLLAQIDSSVGGKTGVNRPLGKNLVGAFHQPSLVVADTDTLRTLPEREWNAGWHEALKYGVIRDEALFERLAAAMPFRFVTESEPTAAGQRFLIDIVSECCRMKAAVVARDEREAGERKILNFGHTVGHAIEAVTRYRKYRHGEAVGIGMVAACEIAVKVGLLADAEAVRVAEAVRRVGRMPAARGISAADVVAALKYDKKASGGKVHFILPDRIGAVREHPAPSDAVLRRCVERTLASFD